jgi:nucleotide-binding universal stress UspA family protein
VHRILIPLDGSPLAEAVMPTAVELGQALSAEWVLLRVVAPSGAPWMVEAGAWGPVAPLDMMGPLLEEQKKDAQSYLEAVRAKMPDPGRVHLDVREDVLPSGIIEAVREHQATYVAMSTHGRGGINRLVMGSVTDMTIRLSPVPVVVVRPRHVG